MKAHLALLALAALSLAAPRPVLADDGMVTATPVFDQIVSYRLPSHFRPSFEDASDVAYIQEAVPAGESVDTWTEMITMTGTIDAEGAAQTLDKAASMLAGRYQQACADTFTGTSLGQTEIDGHEALLVFLGCGSVAAAAGAEAESVVIVFVQGPTARYTVQWAQHGQPQNVPPVFDPAIWKPRIDQLFPIKLCAPVEGEAAPYPSCLSKE